MRQPCRTKLFYFVGGPVEGRQSAFFTRLAELGGPPPGWCVYPHVGQTGRALHLVTAGGEAEIEAHLAEFASIYERGPIIEVEPGLGADGADGVQTGGAR